MGNKISRSQRSVSSTKTTKTVFNTVNNYNNNNNNNVELIALYDYESRIEGELSFRKGDRMILIDTSNPDWWFVTHFQTHQRGYIPRNHVARLQDDESEEWYAGNTLRIQAVNAVLMSHLPRGTFLIRARAAVPNEFALTIRDVDRDGQPAAKHYKIKRTSNGGYFIAEKRTFQSLRDLVNHYSERADEICYKLTTAVPRIAPTRPDLSYQTQDNWEIPREQIRLEREIGSGNFGKVYHGYWRGVIEVAVKVMLPGSMSSSSFLKEAAIMKTFKHPNLVKLYAVCTEQEPLYIVTEYMVNGSLLSYLRNHGDPLFGRTLINMFIQVANGMMYLESRRIVHRDLAARNVLVGEVINGTLILKVADFGLTRKLREETDFYEPQDTKFPVKWTAPEAMLSNNFTVKSDVWSYGVLLFEITTNGAEPYLDIPNSQQLKEKLRKGYRLPKPLNCPRTIYNEVMLKCWDENPDRRPTFQEIYFYFDNLPEMN